MCPPSEPEHEQQRRDRAERAWIEFVAAADALKLGDLTPHALFTLGCEIADYGHSLQAIAGQRRASQDRQ